MDVGGAEMRLSPGSAARSLRCKRLRGVLRHYWINDGLENIIGAQLITWSTPLALANKIRDTAGLPQLPAEDDPAPDLVSEPAEIIVVHKRVSRVAP